MSPPTDPAAPRPGLLGRLFQSLGRKPQDEPEPPPLFRPRPLPPPEPRGPGLPPLDEILTEAPPAPDPERMPRLMPLPQPDAPVATAPPPAPPPETMAGPAPDAPAAAPVRPMTAAERQAAERIRALVAAGLIADAEALLDTTFAGQTGVVDGAGLPVVTVEAFRCAVALRREADIRRLAVELRPLLTPSNPLLETIVARAAILRRDLIEARAAWHAVLARAPGTAEALDWLIRNPAAPDGGVPAAALIAGPPPALQPAPPPFEIPPPLPDALPPGAPAQWLRNVAIQVLDGAAQTDGNWETARPIAGATPDEVAVLLRDPDDLARPFVLTETVLTLFALARAAEPPLRLARLYAGRQPWAARQTAGPQAEMLAVLFPGLRVAAGFDGAVREQAVLTLDGAARDAATGTLIGGMMPLVARCTTEFRARVFAAFGVPGNERPARIEGRKPQALYLQATPARALDDAVRDRIFALLAEGGFEVSTADMAVLPWRDQVHLAAGADLLFGVHGPAMSTALWAHPAARVLELFPAGVRRYETQLLTEAAGLAYLGLEGVAADGFVAVSRDRSSPPTENPGGVVSDLPWAILQRAMAPRA